MEESQTQEKMGRPPKPFDPLLFEQLCGIHCTKSEIASMLRMCEDTLLTKVEEHYNDTFSVIYKRFQESGKCSLRRHQFALSKKNAGMAIWLGKIYLEQRDQDAVALANRPVNVNINQMPYDRDRNPSQIQMSPVSDPSMGSDTTR